MIDNVKRSLDGTYHAFKFRKYTEPYLGDAMYRFNRRFRLGAMVPRLAEAAACCKPSSERQLRDFPVFGC